MKQVLWALDQYTADDDVVYHEFKSKNEALREASKIAQRDNDGDSLFVLKKYIREGWRQNGMTCWDNNWELDDDWNVTPKGIFDIITKQKVRP